MKKYTLLLVDSDDNRRNQLTSLLNCCEHCCVVPKAKISQSDFEQGNYDIVLIHAGNDPEGGCIENEEWDAGNAKIILFSGGYAQDTSEYDGIVYASASYLENKDNLHKLLGEVLDK